MSNSDLPKQQFEIPVGSPFTVHCSPEYVTSCSEDEVDLLKEQNAELSRSLEQATKKKLYGFIPPKPCKGQCPNLIYLGNLLENVHDTQTKLPNGDWVPARALGFSSLWSRLTLAWLVFKGEADALLWPGQ